MQPPVGGGRQKKGTLDLMKPKGRVRKPWRQEELMEEGSEAGERRDERREEDWGERKKSEEDCDENCSCKSERKQGTKEPKIERTEDCMRGDYMHSCAFRTGGGRKKTTRSQ